MKKKQGSVTYSLDCISFVFYFCVVVQKGDNVGESRSF